jgi:CheY-like chemotaxis protein
MIFRVLYIEDKPIDQRLIKEAAEEHNKKNAVVRLFVEAIDHPSQLHEKLDEHFDLIVADRSFPDDGDPGGPESSRLADILQTAKSWAVQRGMEKPLPVIAYAKRDKGVLEECLASKSELYDIWDKQTASPEYVAWRLSKIALDLLRSRPGTLLERMLRDTDTQAPWGEHVKDMAKRYVNSWTERDQIEQAGVSIGNIADSILSAAEAKKLKDFWEVMKQWEPLGRGLSPKVRGHARHVVNVFWMGYCLIHAKNLKKVWESLWQGLKDNRAQMGLVNKISALDAFSNMWFYAALYHDIANWVPEVRHVNTVTDKLATWSGGCLTTSAIQAELKDTLANRCDALIGSFGTGSLKEFVESAWTRSKDVEHPDHGIVAAGMMANAVVEPSQSILVAEAARAMILHNLLGTKEFQDSTLQISWASEPCACLLALCDQFQTWDRERYEVTSPHSMSTLPERAELESLTTDSDDAGKPSVSMGIQYIAPEHTDYAPVLFRKMSDTLNEILVSKPKAALERLTDWPFKVEVTCRLRDTDLTCSPIRLGVKSQG